ncbi:MAG: hypothetical protein WA118_08125 [Carboxydocellales bacterium]
MENRLERAKQKHESLKTVRTRALTQKEEQERQKAELENDLLKLGVTAENAQAEADEAGRQAEADLAASEALLPDLQ